MIIYDMISLSYTLILIIWKRLLTKKCLKINDMVYCKIYKIMFLRFQMSDTNLIYKTQ